MTTTAERLRAIIAELGEEFFERREQIEAMVTAALAGQHTFLLGPPGTGKSAMVRAWCARIDGANYWETLLDPLLEREMVFGPLDIGEFKTSGRWHRRTDGYLPWAHIAFLDEIGKAGPMVLNPLLTLLNERRFHNNSTPTPVPLIAAVAASNEVLEPELAALWDRWLMRLVVAPIQEPASVARLLTAAPTPGRPTTVELEEFERARLAEVPAVTVPAGVVDAVLQLKSDLAAEQIVPSDRRWRQCVGLLQAAAWLRGSASVDEDDLGVLAHALWDDAGHRQLVQTKVLSVVSPHTRAVAEIDAMLADIDAGIDARAGEPLRDRAAYGAEANGKAAELARRLERLASQAAGQGRSAARLADCADRIAAVRARILHDCLGVPATAAGVRPTSPTGR